MERHIDNQLVSTNRAADLLGIQKTTLANWRTAGRTNLAYVKIGSRVMYREVDLESFIQSNMKQRTGGDQ